MVRAFGWACGLALVWGATAGAQEVGVDWVSERGAWTPGETVTVGLRFEVEEGWHLYWANAGDSGIPPGVELRLSEGLEVAGEWAWPVPERHVYPGDLVDYIYEGEVVLLLPIRVAEDVEVGASLEITADAYWLVCQEACLPGEGSATLTLSVGDAEPEEGGAVAEARGRLPLPADPERVRGRWEGTELVVEAPGAARLTVFPLTPPRPSNVLEGGEVEGAQTRLQFSEAAEARAVVVREDAAGVQTAYRLVVPAPQ